MSNPINSSDLPTRIRAQLAETEQRIADLIAVRDGLLRVYVRVSSQDEEEKREVRSNSYDRLLIESTILEELKAAEGNRIPTRELFVHARGANPKLKYNTFRSHLTRLKERGLIAAEARARGFWKLSGVASNALE
jgi:hypothetical protein